MDGWGPTGIGQWLSRACGAGVSHEDPRMGFSHLLRRSSPSGWGGGTEHGRAGGAVPGHGSGSAQAPLPSDRTGWSSQHTSAHARWRQFRRALPAKSGSRCQRASRDRPHGDINAGVGPIFSDESGELPSRSPDTGATAWRHVRAARRPPSAQPAPDRPVKSCAASIIQPRVRSAAGLGQCRSPGSRSFVVMAHGSGSHDYRPRSSSKGLAPCLRAIRFPTPDLPPRPLGWEIGTGGGLRASASAAATAGYHTTGAPLGYED
jgi:hypothetical protein